MTKTISLSDESYNALSAVRRSGESFSGVALRLAQGARQDRRLSLAGAWKLSRKEAEEFKRRIYEERERPPDRGLTGATES